MTVPTAGAHPEHGGGTVTVPIAGAHPGRGSATAASVPAATTASAPAAHPDRGSATVLVLGLAAVLLVLGGLLVSLGAVSVARHRAALAADLAALAAAEQAHRGPAACAAARSVAAANGASLPRCVLSGPVAEVTAEVRPAGPLARVGSATARARAGPASLR